MKIVIHSNAAWGGIVDYMVWQAKAMASAGHDISLVVPINFEKPVPKEIDVIRALPLIEHNQRIPKWLKRIDWIIRTLKGWKITAKVTLRIRPDALLLSAYVEYLSPLWKHHFEYLRKKLPELKIGAVVHDPIRRPFGPVKFHRKSVQTAYELLDVTFVHNPVELDQEGASPKVPTFEIPFGVFHFPDASDSRKSIRAALDVPNDAILLFAFGHIRDGKNLDLAVRSLSEFPNLYLVIAGKVTSSGDRPVSFYESLASDLNVSDRLRILNRFIPDDEAANLFAASDFVLLSYDSQFVSASSVLHVALKFRKLVLATSGDGHLKWAVEKYCLGVWTKPDSQTAIQNGLAQLLTEKFNPRWDGYERENTWEQNASRVVDTFETTGLLR